MPAAALIDRYREQGKYLLPPGRALSRSPDSVVVRMLEGVAVEFARVHERARELLGEIVPDRVEELLPEWEDVTGLPDCGEPDTTEERQRALVSKLVARGDQSDSTFEAIAEAVGFDVELAHKYLPAVCTGPCTAPVAGIEWAFAKEVTGSGTGDLEILKCRMRAHAHLYGHLIFGDIDTTTVWGTQAGEEIVTQSGENYEFRQ